MMAHLRTQAVIAVDTESNSLFRYYPKVCLIQVTAYLDEKKATPEQVVDYLVDPLQLPTVEALGAIFSDKETEVIMHAAENDILTMQRDFGFTFNRIFDTQLAARILGWKQVGLAAILQELFGVTSDKRMQRTDWGKRPLVRDQITYAQIDTHYLPALRLHLIEQLHKAKRWQEAQEAFTLLQQVDYSDHEPTPRSFWQMKQTRNVPRAATNVLEALWQWREAEAQQRDRPPFKIATDHLLVTLATKQPTTAEELAKISGVGTYLMRQYGKTLLEVIRNGLQQPLPELPEPGSRPDQNLSKPLQNRFEALRRWRTNVAKQRGVAPEIVFSNSILLTIAQQAPQSEADLLTIPEIGPWKARTYGNAILATLRTVKE